AHCPLCYATLTMKKALGLLRQNELMFTLCVMVALVMVGLSMVSPILPLYGRTFGVNDTLVGLIVSAYPIARLLTNTPAGRLADRFGRRPFLLGGMCFTAVSSIVCGLAPVYAVLLFGRFLEGIGSALFITSAQATIADISTTENRGRMMSTFQGSFLLGSTAGPSIGGVIASAVGARGVFFVYSLMALLALSWTFIRRRTIPVPAVVEQATIQEATSPRRTSPFAAWRYLSDISFLAICLLTLAQFFTRTGTRTTALPLLGADRYHLGEEAIGGILTLATIGNLVCVPLAGWMVDNLGRKAAIVPSTILSGISVVCFIVSPNILWFTLSAALFGISTGIAGPAPSAYVADLAEGQGIGARLGVYRSFGDIGFILGPICMGIVSDAAGYGPALAINAALIITTGLFFALVARETGGKRARARAATADALHTPIPEPLHDG
ncbi:MAG TPA: MFS transporter, partial [Thermomicrobiales bacterium]